MSMFSRVLLLMTLAGCTPGLHRVMVSPPGAPYAPSPLIMAVHWDFSTVDTQRQAHGSDLWPCAWTADGGLVCAWGDGGGFDGDSDTVGRVSLGFARISGIPQRDDPAAVRGRNLWGAPPYAEAPATFGGKVGSVTAVGGRLYAHGGFWTTADTPDPVHHSGRGPRNSVAWSDDGGRTWQLAPWSSDEPLGSFLDEGQDGPAAATRPLLLYFQRPGDTQNLYLKRLAADHLLAEPANSASEYFAGRAWWTGHARWSPRPSDAVPVFTDPHHVEGASVVHDRALQRYLLTAGHYASGNDDDSSAGQVGLFEAPTPWGPWRTVGYYEDWGGRSLNADTRGDFLSLRLPSKWFSEDGRSFWGVFSGLGVYDSFNIVRGELTLTHR